MSLTELFPNVKLLPHADKLRLMQFLVIELAQEEGVSLLATDTEYPLKNTVLKYEDPTEPIAEADWGVLQ